MRMRRSGALATVIVPTFALVAGVGAQAAPALPPVPGKPAAASTMLATDHYLFVIHGDVLYQFDVDSLAVRHRFAFPAGAKAQPLASRAGGDGQGAALQVARKPAEPSEARESVAVVISPAPPPLPPARSGDELKAAVDAALAWLVRHQDDDGKWDCDNFMKHDGAGDPSDGAGNAVHDVGVTGLAMLALLGNGNTMRSGPHKDAVKRAAKWLKDSQQENGLIGVNASHDFIYDHAIATYALCEAYGLSQYELLKPVAQKGIDYLESHRNPYSVWRYQPRDNDNDTSVTTWAALAMLSADSFGLTVNKNTLKLVAVWYDQVTSPDGRAGYSKAGEPSSRLQGDHMVRYPVENGETMTAAATLGRLLLGQAPKEKPILSKSAALLASKPPRWEPGHIDCVYWFFGTYAMFQIGGESWQSWQRALGVLVDQQEKEGNVAGSWRTAGVWDETGGRVFATALNALSLEACLRAAQLRK